MYNLRVLHFIPGMFGGGAEKQLTLLARQMFKSGIETHVAYCVDGENSQRLMSSGANIHKLRDLHFYDPRLSREIKKLIEKTQPDRIITWLEPMDIAAGRIAAKMNIPWCICERSRGPLVTDESFRARLRRSWRIKCAKKASIIICNSNPACEKWQRTINVPCGITSNIVDVEEFETLEPADFSKNKPLIVMAGRFEKPKNYLFAIEALKDVDAEVLIFGQGSLRKQIKNKIEYYNLTERIHLRPYSDDLGAYLKRADLFVSTSIYEGFPNVVLEAIACGTPLLLSEIPTHEQFRTAEANLALINDAKTFASAIKSALVQKNKPDKSFLLQFAPDQISEKFIDLLKSI